MHMKQTKLCKENSQHCIQSSTQFQVGGISPSCHWLLNFGRFVLARKMWVKLSNHTIQDCCMLEVPLWCPYLLFVYSLSRYNTKIVMKIHILQSP